MFKVLGPAVALALATSLLPATAVSQRPVDCAPAVKDADPMQESGAAAWMIANCRLTVYALGDDGKVWQYWRKSPDREILPEELKWRTGWWMDAKFGEGVASAPSIARDGSWAVALVDGTVRLDGQSIGGDAKHVEAAGNASRTFYARPFILNWWPNHDPHLGSADAVPTHTAVFLWWSDGYVHYRTRNNGGRKAWSNWIKLSHARVYSDPAVVARMRQPYLDVFAQGENNTLVHWTWNGDEWQFETVPIARPASAPTVLITTTTSNYGINTTAVAAGKFSCAGKYGSLAFHDAIATNMCWSCPADYKRTVWQPIGHYAKGKWTGIPNGCEQGGVIGLGAKISPAIHHGPMGCPAGAFRNGLTDDCYRCPGRGQRTIVPGNDLTKMSDACRQTVWGTLSVVYLGVNGKIEGMHWNPGSSGWSADTIAVLPKEFAKPSSAPVLAQMDRLFLFARGASGEFLLYAFAAGMPTSNMSIGAPRKPARGIPAIIEIATYVERWR